MVKTRFVDYSGAAPILLPVRVMHHWCGFYVPADPGDDSPDLEVAGGAYRMCHDFDFTNPKTDYDRACALGGIPAVQSIPVGPGFGLVFATEIDPLTWWPGHRMIVNGSCLPRSEKLKQVEWSDELVWEVRDSEFVLMNACDHGAAPRPDDSFDVQLGPGEYRVQWGQYGWEADDPALILFRFVPVVRG